MPSIELQSAEIVPRGLVIVLATVPFRSDFSPTRSLAEATEIAAGLKSDLQRQGCMEVKVAGTMIKPIFGGDHRSGQIVFRP